MTPRMLRCLLTLCLMCLGPLCAASAWAQTWPSKPIRLIVPFGPGSGSDIIARSLGKYLQERWKQPVVIDNRPGANGVIGTEALRNAPADGYTIGISTNSTHAAAPFLVSKLPFDPMRDFEHVALIGVGGSVALVAAGSPYKSFADLISYIRAHPGQVFFGHADTSSLVPAELLKARGNLPVDGVGYKTSANMIADLIGGHIQFAFANYMTGAAQVAGGRLIPVAISEPRRNPRWAGIPTVAEVYPGFEVVFFAGISAPRGVPAEIVQKLARAIQDAQSDPAFHDPLDNIGMTFVRHGPDQYRAFILRETERWKEYVRAARIAPQ